MSEPEHRASRAAAKRSVGAAHAAWPSVPGKASPTTAYPAACIEASPSSAQAKRPRAGTDLLQDAERKLALLERAVRDGDGRLGIAIAAQLEPVIRDAYGADLDADARNRLIEIDLRARSLEGRAASLAEAPGAGPLSARPARNATEAREHLESAVARAEHLANSLSGSRADVTSRIPQAAQELTAVLDRVDVEISQMVRADPKLPAQLGAAFERLDRAMTTLFSLGRGFDLPLQGSGLEPLFDAYDQLRSDADQPPRPSLADGYYDRTLRPASEQRLAPGAHQLAGALTLGTDAAPAASMPRNRDDLVDAVLGFGSDLGRTLERGRAAAGDIITEPPPVEHPDAVELLAELAAGFVLAGAGAIIGEAIDAGFAALKGAGQEGTDSAVANILKDTFKDDGKDAFKEMPKLVTAAGREETGSTPEETSGIEGNDKLSAKTKFLAMTRTRTDAAVSATEQRFQAFKTQLNRVPVDVLLPLSRSFNATLQKEIEDAYRQSVIREWVNFTKQLGEDQRGPGAQLANMGDPVGVLQIRVKIEGEVHDLSDMRNNKVDGLAFERARVAGMSPAVIADLRKQPFTLGSLPVGRRVTCSMSDLVPDVVFDIDRTGGVSLPPMPRDASTLLAMVGGTQAVLEYLDTISTQRIDA